MQEPAVWGILAALSFVPPVAFAFVVRSQERFAREPLPAVLASFAYGATLGIAVALLLSLAIDQTLAPGVSLGLVWGAVFVAPFAEELAKGLGLGFLGKRIDEVEDGLVHGAAIGLGFAATETLLYGLVALDGGSASGAVGVVVVRNVSSMLLHAGSSAMVGFGYSLWRVRRRSAVLLGAYLLAAALHASYNLLVTRGTWLAFVLAIAMVVAIAGLLLGQIRRLDRSWRPA